MNEQLLEDLEEVLAIAENEVGHWSSVLRVKEWLVYERLKITPARKEPAQDAARLHEYQE